MTYLYGIGTVHRRNCLAKYSTPFSTPTSVQWLSKKPLFKKYAGNPVKFHTDYLGTAIE